MLGFFVPFVRVLATLCGLGVTPWAQQYFVVAWTNALAAISAWFDTVINEYLIREGGLDIRDGAVVGYCVESNCRYHRPVAFPEAIDAGLRVAHLGNSSVRYEIGLFRQGEDKPAAQGHFVHVFVDGRIAEEGCKGLADRLESEGYDRFLTETVEA